MRPMRRTLLVAAAVLAWIGVSAVPASAHSVSGQSATNLQTHLKSVAPALPGLTVKVVESGSRLEVTNTSGQEVIVLGYKDEPYLRIGPEGVFQNRLSTATYINKTRTGVEPPEAATKAKVGDTDWEKISSEPLARWHDHRIHWMSPSDPPEARAEPGKRHVINADWVVPMKAGAGTINVKGDLVWEPGPSALPWFLLIAILVAVAVILGRQASWAAGLAAATAVLVVVDVFHFLGLGLANAGGFGYQLGKAFSGSPFAVLGWAVGILAVVWLLRRGSDGLPLAALAGLEIALVGGITDINALSRSEVPFGFSAGTARFAIAVSIGLGFGIALAAALRLGGVFGSVARRAPRGYSEEPNVAAG
jgi:hypothetical protein